MLSLRSKLAATMGGALLLAATATPAFAANGRPLFVWSGTVDREAIIVMRGASVETRGDGYDGYADARFRVLEALPRMVGNVSVQREDGRGGVDVIEQPSAFNGYTARVRVRDRASGADRYRLIVTWEPVRGFGGRDDRDGYDGRRDDRRDDRYDGRRDDRRDDRDRRGGAFGSGVLRWSGAVDDVAEIRISGRDVSFVTRSGRPLYNVRYSVSGAGLPAAPLPLDLRRFAGRGNVTITEYPRAWNNWTAVIRIDDSRGGADGYEFDLRW
ncbi:MAG: hypothetical protein IT355_02380 [Gemmatimonadaceae bacterium]|nr:hypothetical protein [Gemmatimonadaceae bacterium]